VPGTYNVIDRGREEIEMKRRELIKRLEKAGFRFAREGSKHTVYQKGSDEEQIPRHREIDEITAKEILKRWGLK
jgi:mRNA interferase HicA